jgi:hypothetical protein
MPLAPDAGAVKVTTRSGTGLPPLSRTVATSRFANGWPAGVLCPDPLVAAIEAGGPAVFVSAKLAGVWTPAAAAVTVKEPMTLFAVRIAEKASPD